MKVEDQVVSNPKYMIVGEAPGAEEARMGQPFVGRSGQQLNRLLTWAGIHREECYITNVIDEQPEKNDFGIFYSDSKRNIPTEKLEGAWNLIRGKIEQVKPKVVIALGNEPLKAITGFKGIEVRRGSIYSVGDTPIVPTFHPSAILRGGGTSNWYMPAAIHDLQRAKAVAERKLSMHQPRLALLQEPGALDEWFAEVAGSHGYCAFDIETSYGGVGEWIKCIGFAASEEEGVVVPFPETSAEDFFETLQVIKKWMTSGKIKWIGQNAYNFDIPYIKRNWGFEVDNLYVDTMVLHHMLYPEFPHSLATISSFYTTIPYWKDTSEQDLYKYNAFDAVATYVSAMKMVEEAKKIGMWPLYENYYSPLLRPLRIIHERGIRIDLDYQKEMRDALRKEIKTLQADLDSIYQRYTNTGTLKVRLSRLRALQAGGRKTVKLTNRKSRKRTRCRVDSQIKKVQAAIEKQESLNVRSTKELGHFLYTTLELPVKTRQGKVTTDETALNQLFLKTQHPFLKTMITLRQKRNTLSRWGNLKTDGGLVTTTYSFAETGRLRSGRYDTK